MNEKTLYYMGLIKQYCEREAKLFTARRFVSSNKIPKKDLGYLATALRCLSSQGKIKKWRKKVWKWDGYEEKKETLSQKFGQALEKGEARKDLTS